MWYCWTHFMWLSYKQRLEIQSKWVIFIDLQGDHDKNDKKQDHYQSELICYLKVCKCSKNIWRVNCEKGNHLPENISESCKHWKITANHKLKVNNVIMWQKLKLIIIVAECINRSLTCKIFQVIHMLYLRLLTWSCVSSGHHTWIIWTWSVWTGKVTEKGRKNDIWKTWPASKC